MIADRWSSRCIRIISSHTNREEKKWVSSLQSWFWFLSTLNISWFLFIIGCAISLVCLDGFISLYVVLFECSVTYTHAAQHYLEREREGKEILKSNELKKKNLLMTIDNATSNKISIALWLYSVASPHPPSHSLSPYQKKHKITGSFSAKWKCHEMVPQQPWGQHVPGAYCIVYGGRKWESIWPVVSFQFWIRLPSQPCEGGVDSFQAMFGGRKCVHCEYNNSFTHFQGAASCFPVLGWGQQIWGWGGGGGVAVL